MSAWGGLLATYGRWLGDPAPSDIVTLNEGNTPLIYAGALSERLGATVYLKFDGLNPTGSFKDRGMTVAMSRAKARGAAAVICGSTGNTSASAAAYAAKAGLTCAVLVPGGYVAMGKLAQAVMYGATVIQIDGNFDLALNLARQLGDVAPITVVNSINPDRIDGQMTGAFEVCDQLDGAPDILSIPVGNAGNITAYWRGFTAYHEAALISRRPAMWGWQAAGAAPLVLGHVVEEPDTIATAIRIGNPASADGARRAVSESDGQIRSVTDAQILEAYQFLARHEGVFCEPTSAASVAGLLVNGVPEGATVVCVLTGNGLKDPDTALSISPRPLSIESSVDALRATLDI
jgi:threonine synthase